MGIGFHVKDYDCKARWSYTGYLNFRKKIASSLGLILETTAEFKWVEQDWNKWDKDWLIFLTHSDCSGYFTPYRCGRIAKKLKIVLEKWSYSIDIMSLYDIEHGKYLISALEYCKENNKRMYLS